MAGVIQSEMLPKRSLSTAQALPKEAHLPKPLFQPTLLDATWHANPSNDSAGGSIVPTPRSTELKISFPLQRQIGQPTTRIPYPIISDLLQHTPTQNLIGCSLLTVPYHVRQPYPFLHAAGHRSSTTEPKIQSHAFSPFCSCVATQTPVNNDTKQHYPARTSAAGPIADRSEP